MTFMEKIDELARARGITQVDVEREARLPKNWFSKRKNAGQVKLTYALALAKFFNVSLDTLADPAAPWPPRDQPPLGVDELVVLELARAVGLDNAKRAIRNTIGGPQERPQIVMGRTVGMELPEKQSPAQSDQRRMTRSGK